MLYFYDQIAVRVLLSRIIEARIILFFWFFEFLCQLFAEILPARNRYISTFVLLFVNLQSREPSPQVFNWSALNAETVTLVFFVPERVYSRLVNNYIAFLPAALVLGLLINISMNIDIVFCSVLVTRKSELHLVAFIYQSPRRKLGDLPIRGFV